MSENPQTSEEAQSLARPRLLYFADTMCSWCYGFAPEMAQVLEKLGERVEVLLFSGGLRPFNTEPVDDKLRGYLAETYPRIAELSGQPFGAPRSMQPGFVYDSEPASRALVTLRHLAPGREHGFMLALQRAFYDAGEDITNPEVLADHAAEQGVDRAGFLAAFGSEEAKQETLADFEAARRFEIDGFPTLIVHKQDAAGADELILVSKGYAKADEVLTRLEMALAA